MRGNAQICTGKTSSPRKLIPARFGKRCNKRRTRPHELLTIEQTLTYSGAQQYSNMADFTVKPHIRSVAFLRAYPGIRFVPLGGVLSCAGRRDKRHPVEPLAAAKSAVGVSLTG